VLVFQRARGEATKSPATTTPESAHVVLTSASPNHQNFLLFLLADLRILDFRQVLPSDSLCMHKSNFNVKKTTKQKHVIIIIYTKIAHVKQVFSPYFPKPQKCAFSVRKFRKVGKTWKRVRYLPFSKKMYIPAGKNRSKLILSGVFEFFFSKEVRILLRANRKKTKTFIFFFAFFLLHI
jgi:hypothetical protein